MALDFYLYGLISPLEDSPYPAYPPSGPQPPWMFSLVDRKVEMKTLDERLAALEYILIASPPRCASTALARSLHNHPAVGRRYIHEPCGDLYHEGDSIRSVTSAFLKHPMVHQPPPYMLLKR